MRERTEKVDEQTGEAGNGNRTHVLNCTHKDMNAQILQWYC